MPNPLEGDPHDAVPVLRVRCRRRRSRTCPPRTSTSSTSRSTCSTPSSRRPAPGCSAAGCTRPTPPPSCAPRTATSITTDGPFAETKEQLGGFWIIEAADLDAALALGRQRLGGLRAPVEVRPFQDEPPVGVSVAASVDGALAAPTASRSRAASTDVATTFREESGRAVATLVRLFGDIDIAEEAVQEAFVHRHRTMAGDGRAAEPGRLDHRPPRGTGRSTGCAARQPP